MAALAEALCAEGLTLAEVSLIVCTHAHAGHAGQAAAVQAISGAPVAAHPAVLASLKSADTDASRKWVGELSRYLDRVEIVSD